jgi:myosin heavy subunit
MNRQQLLRPALVALLISAWPFSTGARTSHSTATHTPTPAPAATPAITGATPPPPALTSLNAAAQATRLATLKTRGDAEIERRLANLKTAQDKIAGLSTLSSSDKQALTTLVKSDITNLTNLKTKLDSDTTLADARTDVQSIITDYRVYLLALPVTRLVEAIDRLTTVETKLTTLQAKLQGASDKAQTQGKDVTAVQKDIADMQTQLSAAQNATSGLTAKLLALQPADYNANHTVLLQYRQAVQTAVTAAKAARDDAKAAIDALSGNAPSPTAGASTSPGASASPVTSASPKAHCTLSPNPGC